METIPKCLLLPIDGTEEAMLPIYFVARLFPRLDLIDLLLCYFVPPLPPIYDQHPISPQMLKKKKELLHEREQNAQNALNQAKRVLVLNGFSEERIQEHTQEKAMSVAHHACQLADIKKVDAVLVQKRISSPLEGLLKDDPSNALLHYCIVSPVWFMEGEIDPSRALICIQDEEPSLRAVDHAAFMLAGTETALELVHVTPSASHILTSPGTAPSADLQQWFKTEAGKQIEPFITEACKTLQSEGIDESKCRITILPGKQKGGKVAAEVLSYAKKNSIGIVVLGHSNPEGVWSFLKTSVTRKILGEFENMSVWVNQ